MKTGCRLKILAATALVLIFCSTTAAAAPRMAVAVSKANVRSGPGSTYDVLWQVERYHPLQVIQKTAKWVRFRDFEGDEGWISRDLLDKTPTVITRKKCHVRSGPGKNFPIVFTIDKGIPFKVLGRKGKWIHIEHADGDKGWIFKTLVW